MSVATQTHGGYLLTGDPKFPQTKRIRPQGRGTVPKELSGLYTSFQAAKDAIDARELREKAEAEAKAEKQAADKKAKRVRLKMEEPDAPEADTTIRDEPVREGTGDGGKPS